MILPPNHLALKGCLRPPAMAIGDSMFNGVRSLTIHDELAAVSPVQQFAEAVGLPRSIRARSCSTWRRWRARASPRCSPCNRR